MGLGVMIAAFKDDPMYNWVAGLEDGDPERDQKMHDLVRYLQAWVDRRLISGGQGFALGIKKDSDALAGCMTIASSSHADEGGIDSFVNLFKLGAPPLTMLGREDRYGEHSLKRLLSMKPLVKKKKQHMKDTERWIYLQASGVLPEHQGKGYGKKMMHLETESEQLESMYSKRFGFRTAERVTVCASGDKSSTANFTMYLMRRDTRE